MTRTRNDTLDSGIITDGEDAVSADYNAEIKLAERGFHVLMERIAMKRMPGDALPSGDVFDLLNAAGEQLEIQALQNNDKKVSKRRMKKTTQQLVSAIESLTEWPEEPRLQVASLLVPTLRMVELVSVADNLLVALQQADSPGADVEEETATDLRITAADRTRSILDSGQWTPDLDDLLRELREMSAENPDDEGLLDTLKRGILFNATAGREHLLLEERRRLVAAEPLPKELAKALEKLPDDVIDSEFVRLGLHLVLADVVAAGLVPEKTSPKMTIAATLVAMLRLDEPGKKPDIGPLGSWAKTMALKIDVLSDEMAPVFKWKPPDYEDSIERRHEKRWKVRSLMYQFLPVRWTPARHEELPPYNTAKARERLEELRGVAWLMIDQLEPVRLVSEAFRYGDGGPDAMDLELVHDIIELWEEQSLVSAVEEFGRAYLEDEWHHEIPDAEVEDASVILPAAVTSDGEPLVLSTVVFDVTEGSSGEIVEHLDSADGFRREAGNEGDRWEWLGPSAGSDRVVADLVLDGDVLTVMTHSLARASRTNARLADELGDRIELKDIRTEQPSPEALAELGIEMVGEEGSETQQDDQKQVVHQVLEKHYRKWLDEALPAFGDLSPRDAVTDPMRRSEVIAHLVEAEERTRASSWPMNEFDFEFLWSELGLDRTEAS
jgi:hypothetical protein